VPATMVVVPPVSAATEADFVLFEPSWVNWLCRTDEMAGRRSGAGRCVCSPG
jgi:hypothetical protein